MAEGDVEDGRSPTDSGETAGLGCSLQTFTEAAIVEELIKSLSNNAVDVSKLEASKDKFKDIIDQYQEQPHLLDTHLDWMLSELIEIARSSTTASVLMHQCFRYLSLITKVRGYKVVVRHLPHEVADLEPVLALLVHQNPKDVDTWETRYMLLLWLSIIVIIPFHLSRLDSIPIGDGHHRTPIAQRIMEVAKKYLSVSDKSRDAAAYLIAKFVTRPDASDILLPEFVTFALQIIQQWDVGNMFSNVPLVGTMTALALIFKHGKREDLLVYVDNIIKGVPLVNQISSQETVLRKLTMKLIQRIGLIFLKPRVAQWRYQRGSRSIAINLAAPSNIVPSDDATAVEKIQADEEDYDIPEQVEDVIEQLLMGLGDRDTIVRWSAAKGIGRVTGRLPKEMADDVVGSVLLLFNLRENDNSWHGGCLALAELGRRGLLLPHRLNDVVPIILKALVYDEQRGNFSIGAHIRDAACYVCWAFARAYEVQEMTPYVQKIASALLITTVFDREINCRRAASAAFQENVGRQGTFPHGIDILTTADYHAVAIRSNCYLNLSVFVAQFSEYTLPLVDHLVGRKISHWDSGVRELSTVALHKLTPCAPDHMLTAVLPQLLRWATGIDLQQRHGAILGLGEVTHGLALVAWSKQMSLSDVLVPGTDVHQELKELIPKLQARHLFRGLGGELMRQAAAKFIEKLSLAHYSTDGDTVIDVWHELLVDNLSHDSATVQSMTVEALPALFEHWNFHHKVSPNHETTTESYYVDTRQRIVTHYISQLQSTSLSTRTGFAKALGAFPKFMLEHRLGDVLDGLAKCSYLGEQDPQRWAEARRDAIGAITSICKTVGFHDEKDLVDRNNLDLAMNAFLQGLEDYTMDSRGDIGAWVREASMTGIQVVVLLAARENPGLITPELSSDIATRVVQQAEEKIDRTRAHAAKVLISLLHGEPSLPHIPHYQDLLLLFPKDECGSINWGVAANTFPRFTPLLAFPVYTRRTLLGLVVSVGGLTESLVKHASASLTTFLQSILDNKEEMSRFGSTLLELFKDHLRNTRVSIPMLNTLEYLLVTNAVVTLVQDPDVDFAGSLFDLVKAEVANSKDPIKIVAGVSVLCGLLQAHEAVLKRTLSQIAVFLCHRYPHVRKATANKLYESLLTYDGVASAENLEEVMSILLETSWDQPIAEVRPIRNRLCILLDVPTPKPASSNPQALPVQS